MLKGLKGEIMISQRFNLFYAGYTASLPSLFFSKQKIKESFHSLDNSKVDDSMNSYFSDLEDEKVEYLTHLTSALSLAKTFEFEDFDIPNSSADYFKWFDEYVHVFEDKFPMGRMEHYYFLYARKLAELVKDLELIKTYIDLQILLKGEFDYSKNIENSILDSEYIVFKLMAPAALLSGEPRQGCFNNLYKQLASEIGRFKDFKNKELSPVDLINLKQTVDDLKVIIINGFKKCIDTLNKLSEE